jgi:hypothetical protein
MPRQGRQAQCPSCSFRYSSSATILSLFARI